MVVHHAMKLSIVCFQCSSHSSPTSRTCEHAPRNNRTHPTAPNTTMPCSATSACITLALVFIGFEPLEDPLPLVALAQPGYVPPELAEVLPELERDVVDGVDLRVVEQLVVGPPLGLLAVEVQLAQHPLQGRLGVETFDRRSEVGLCLPELRQLLLVVLVHLRVLHQLGVRCPSVLHRLPAHRARPFLSLLKRLPRFFRLAQLGLLLGKLRLLLPSPSPLFGLLVIIKVFVGEDGPFLVGQFGWVRRVLERLGVDVAHISSRLLYLLDPSRG
mmetsp:Transcript_27487/g.53536  ORF Transcript_27487/g.53536 Transcript_27487/m.53536 type:complete len:272 (-) Transcript_27487:567-1382(-)